MALKINLEISSTKITLWSNEFSKSIGKPETTAFNQIFKIKSRQGETNSFALNQFQLDKTSNIGFFEISDSIFNPNLRHLEDITEKLMNKNQIPKLLFEFEFTESDKAKRSLKAEAFIDPNNQNKIIQIFSLLRNINNPSIANQATRMQVVQSDILFEFKVYTAV